MSEKAIDEKKAALEAAKYAFFQDVNFIRHPAYVQAPDGWKYYADEPSSHWLSAEAFEAEQLEDMVNKAREILGKDKP